MTSQNDHCGSSLPDHARQEPLIPAETGDSHLTYTACLSVTVDNYSHTSEHLFEFVQRHAGEYRFLDPTNEIDRPAPQHRAHYAAGSGGALWSRPQRLESGISI